MTNIKLMRLLLHFVFYLLVIPVINLIYVSGYIHGSCIDDIDLYSDHNIACIKTRKENINWGINNNKRKNKQK